MDNNKNNNKNASHLTHEMKKNHGDIQTASMKALITQKVDELNDIRKKQLAEKEIQAEIEEESRKKERESFKRERKSLERRKETHRKRISS